MIISKKLIPLVVFSFILCNLYPQKRKTTFPGKYYSIEEINRNALTFEQYKVPLKVKGYMLQQMSRIMFKFEDETGMIQLNIPPELYPEHFYNKNIEIIVMGYVNFSEYDKSVINVKKVIVPRLSY